MTEIPSILALEGRPADADTVATWIKEEWGRLPIHDYFEAVLRGDCWDALFPKTLIALCNDRVIGTISILLDDLETRPDLNPWIGCLYVVPALRRHGIGTRLLAAAEKEAGEGMGTSTIYLFTENQTALYARNGWLRLGSDQYHGRPIALMWKDVTPGLS